MNLKRIKYTFKVWGWRAPKWIWHEWRLAVNQRCHACNRRLDEMAQKYGSGGAIDIETHRVERIKATVYFCNPCYRLVKSK